MSADIKLARQTSKLLPGVTLLRVQGSIDSDTAPVFEKALEELLADKVIRLLVDLAGVEYVSSAGIGIFIGMLQRFRAHAGGDLKACRASKKIMKVFESIGLTDMMEFLPEESDLKKWHAAAAVVETLDHFQLSTSASQVFCGEGFPLRVECRDAGQNLVKDFKGKPKFSVSEGLIFPAAVSEFNEGVWRGEVVVTGSGQVTLTLTDGRSQGTLTLESLERPNKAEFPLTVSCQTCKTELSVHEPDIYRCENCDETFFVDAWGHHFTLKPGSTAQRRKSRYKGFELKINTDVNYLSIVRQAISGLCEKENLDAVISNSVVLAVDEILLNLIEHTNDFDPWQVVRIRVECQRTQLKIQIRDYGDPYDVTTHKNQSLKSSVLKGSKRGLGGFLVNQIMDQVKYESLPNYNDLTMVKSYGEPETASN